MAGGTKAKLLCSFGGELVREQGRASYVGGKTRLVSIERSASFRSLLAKMSELCGAEPSSLDVRFRLPDVTIGVDTPLVSVESDDDVRSMMEEFDSGQKIPIFLFTANAQNTDDEIAADEGVAFGAATAVETVRYWSELKFLNPQSLIVFLQ